MARKSDGAPADMRYTTWDIVRCEGLAIQEEGGMDHGSVVRVGDGDITAEMAQLRETLKECMQCGTCAATCPVANEMDYTPRQVIHLISLGLEERALGSTAIWICASCTHCTAKCPRSIEISEMMYRLRSLALRRGYKAQPGMVFTQSFLQVVKEHGRTFEAELLLRYSLRTNPLALLRQVGFGVTMFSKGKVSPLPDRIEGRDQVRAILEER
jgi:heterodisulfide reductase subunit C